MTYDYTTDEEFYASEEWRDLSADIMERDGFRCHVCGATEELTVHHIVPRRYKYIAGFDIDSPPNLVTMCWKHHHMADRMVGLNGKEIE